MPFIASSGSGVALILYVSATPGDYELERTDHKVEQIIRPTGLLDPKIEVRPIEGQIDDLVGEINKRIDRNERVFVTTLTKKISSMTTSEITAFASTILADYYNNTNKTVAPNLFVVPTDDYLGLTAPSSDYAPQYSKLQLLLDAFKAAVAGFGVNNFQILPLAYLNKTQMNEYTGVNKYRYVLANKSPDTYYAPVPVEFTMTQFGTRDNFNFENVAYGQIAGTVVLRPQEILYFDFA